MQPDLTQQRQQAHAFLDILPAEELTVVRSLLEVMAEPFSRAHRPLVPMEEEEITPDTAAAMDRARPSLAHGEGIPDESSCASSV